MVIVVQGSIATMVSQHSNVASMAMALQGYSATMASQGSQACSHASIIEFISKQGDGRSRKRL